MLELILNAHKAGVHSQVPGKTPPAPKTASEAFDKCDPYALAAVLGDALEQASKGKGKERHAPNGERFEEQRMLAISRLLNSERGMAFLVCKKVTEGIDLPTTERKVAELLGAINYIAGMVIFLREKDGGA